MESIALTVVISSFSACAPQVTRPAPSSLLRLATEPSITLCEGVIRRFGVGASWEASASLNVSDPPEITWLSSRPDIVEVVDPDGVLRAVGPGTVTLVVHGRLDSAFGRTTVPVTVVSGEGRGGPETDPCH